MRRMGLIIGFLAMIATGCDNSENEVVADDGPNRIVKSHYIAEPKTKVRARRVSESPKPAKVAAYERPEEIRHLSDAEAKVYEQIGTALDENDVNGVLAGCASVTTNSDLTVRQQAVDALAWFGEDLRALERLQSFINDPDEGIAADAFRRMDENTDLIENEKVKNDFLRKSFYRYAGNEQIVDFVCDKLKNDEPNETTMKTLTLMTTSGNDVARARAKAAYKFITGKMYISAEEAMMWVKENQE